MDDEARAASHLDSGEANEPDLRLLRSLDSTIGPGTPFVSDIGLVEIPSG
jgi:hypothetical protein